LVPAERLNAVLGRPKIWRDVDMAFEASPNAARPMDEIADVLLIGAGASCAAVAWSLAETKMKP
jgi:hypothetical protein